MSQYLYRYNVSYNFAGCRTDVEHKTLKSAAEYIENKLSEYEDWEDVAQSINLQEVTYASKRTLDEGFSMQTKQIWGNWLDNEDKDILKALSGKGDGNSRGFTYQGQPMLYKAYAELCEKRSAKERENVAER